MRVVRGADAVVFAAGAGPGSGAARKDTVDRGAAVLLAEAAGAAGVGRYLLVSSTGVDDPPRPGTDEVWAAYLAAKKAAEDAIRASALAWTILRPGALTDEPGTGRVLLAPPPVERAEVTRDDTAAVLVALLDTPATAGQILELRRATPTSTTPSGPTADGRAAGGRALDRACCGGRALGAYRRGTELATAAKKMMMKTMYAMNSSVKMPPMMMPASASPSPSSPVFLI